LYNFPKFRRILKKSIEIRKEFLFELWPIFGFWPSRGPPPLSSMPAHLPAGPVAFGRPHGLPLFALADVRAPPSSPSLSQADRALTSSAHHIASLGHRPSPVPWREADPPRPLPLPLLYWTPPPPPLPVTNAHCHQWRRLHFTVAWSPPSPSTPIKGAPAAPHLTAPHTALLSSSLMLELTPTARLQSPLLCHCHPAASPPLRLW
jgi:hypothetical protein